MPLMTLKVLLPFEIFAVEENVSRIVVETPRRLVRPVAQASGLRGGAGAGHSQFSERNPR